MRLSSSNEPRQFAKPRSGESLVRLVFKCAFRSKIRPNEQKSTLHSPETVFGQIKMTKVYKGGVLVDEAIGFVKGRWLRKSTMHSFTFSEGQRSFSPSFQN